MNDPPTALVGLPGSQWARLSRFVLQNHSAQSNCPTYAAVDEHHIHQLAGNRRAHIDPAFPGVRSIENRTLLAHDPSVLSIGEEDVVHLELIFDLVHLPPGAPAVGSLGYSSAASDHPAVVWRREEYR